MATANSQNKEYMLLEGLKEKDCFPGTNTYRKSLSTKGVAFRQGGSSCELTSVSEPFYIINKGVKLMAFDEFKANLHSRLWWNRNASIGCVG